MYPTLSCRAVWRVELNTPIESEYRKFDIETQADTRIQTQLLVERIETENGVFTDSDEITAENVIYYHETGGKKTKSFAPPADVCFRAFEKNLTRYDDVILVAISSGISNSCSNAKKL